MRYRTTRLRAMAGGLVAAVASSSCGIVTTDATAEVEAAVAALPGVTSVHDSYPETDGFDTSMTLNVDVQSATGDQIRTVVETIDRERPRGLKQIDLSLVPGRAVSITWMADDLDPVEVTTKVEEIRRLADRLRSPAAPMVTEDQIRWEHSADGDDVDVRQITSPVPVAMAAVRDTANGDAVRASLVFIDTSAPVWYIDYPFAVDKQQRVERQLAAMPLTPTVVEVDEGRLTGLHVKVADPATAYTDLTATISATGAGVGRPLNLSWSDTEPQSSRPGFGGSVDVGACAYPDTEAEQHPEKYLTPDAMALRQRLRQEYDTCPR